MFPIKNKKRISEGSVAIFALFLMFILAVATIGIITTATIERKVSISTGNSTTAFQIAESGMEKTLQFFKSNFDKKLSEVGSCSGGNVTYSSNNTIRFKDNAPVPAYITDCNELISKVKIIKSIGTTKQETRAIEEDVFLGATKLLLHFNGWNSSDSFDDSSYYWSNRTVTNPENKVTSNNSDPKKFDAGAAAKFDGVGGYLSILDSDDWSFGSGDFTVDCWVNFSSIDELTNNTIMSQTQDGNNGYWFILQKFMGNYVWYFWEYNGGVQTIFIHSSTSPLSLNTWYHIALVRNGNNWYFFQNGVQLGTTVSNAASVPNYAGPLEIGAVNMSPQSQYLNGYIDELRISKGVARWTSDFSSRLPSAEYWPD